MFKTGKRIIYLVIAVILSLGLSISFQSLLAAWIPPTATPPGGTFSEPLNKGSTAQIKGGPLGINYDNLSAIGLSVMGNVGIGTTVPSTKLDVIGQMKVGGGDPGYLEYSSLKTGVSSMISATGGIGWGSTFIGTNVNYVTSANNKPTIYGNVGGYLNSGAIAMTPDASFPALQFWTGSGVAGTELTQAMGITAGGKVGIGTTTPQSKLAVEGDTYISGNVGIGYQGAMPTITEDSLYMKSTTGVTASYAGSCVVSSYNQKLYCFGGTGAATYATISEFDTNAGQYSGVVTKTATLPVAVYYNSCAEDTSTNKIYCFGGLGNPTVITDYTPSTDIRTTKTAVIPDGGRYQHSCVENSSTHKIYCFGGYSGGNKDTIYEYNPSADTITAKTAKLPIANRLFSCAEDSSTNKIYCFGGLAATTAIYEYTPSTDTMATKSAVLPGANMYNSCAENPSTHKIYCIGGYDGAAAKKTVVEYYPATNTVTTKKSTLAYAAYCNSCSANRKSSRIYCGGGYTSSYVGYVYEYLSGQTVKMKIDGAVRATGGFSTGDEIFMGNLNPTTDYISGSVNLDLFGGKGYDLKIRDWGNVLIMNTNLGIGTENPEAKLEVNGGIKIGMDKDDCNTKKEGTIRYNTDHLEYCNGKDWKSVANN